jgi:hypothetical protein
LHDNFFEKMTHFTLKIKSPPFAVVAYARSNPT